MKALAEALVLVALIGALTTCSIVETSQSHQETMAKIAAKGCPK